MKLLLKITAGIGALLVIVFVGSYFYRMIHSEKIALEEVQQFCIEQGYDVAKLSGPADGKVGGSPVSYSWQYQDPSHHLELLVSFDGLYDPKLAVWDEDRKD